jgi:drug/metabolite transporter (DMT)-like permease
MDAGAIDFRRKGRLDEMNAKTCPVPPVIPILLGIVAVSFSSIFIKWSAAPVSVQGMYRMLFTILLMLPLMWRYRREILRISTRNWLYLSLSGIFLAVHFLFWMGSLAYTSVASSTIIMALEPLFVLLGAFFVFKERTNRTALASMAVAIAGAVLIGWGDIGLSGSQLWGDFLSLLGTLAVAVHMLYGQILMKEVSSSVYSFLVFFIAAVAFACYNWVSGVPMTGYPLQEWGIFALLAVVPTVFGHMVFNWLLSYVNATTVAMSILGEPVGATILAYFLLGEMISPHQITGGMLTIIGLFFFLRTNRDISVAAGGGRENDEQALGVSK